MERISRIYSTAPGTAHERLLSTELIARNILGFGGSQSVLKVTQLPDWTDPNKLLWPPPQPNIAAAMATAFASPPDKRFTSRWWEAAEEIDRGRRQIQAERVKQEEEERAQAYTDYNSRQAGVK